MDVKAIREGAGKSQRELAEWLEVSQSLVAQWERGVAVPSGRSALALGALPRMSAKVVRLDPYPSAPRGGCPGSREAEERLAWVRARNAAIQAGVVSESRG